MTYRSGGRVNNSYLNTFIFLLKWLTFEQKMFIVQWQEFQYLGIYILHETNSKGSIKYWFMPTQLDFWGKLRIQTLERFLFAVELNKNLLELSRKNQAYIYNIAGWPRGLELHVNALARRGSACSNLLSGYIRFFGTNWHSVPW